MKTRPLVTDDGRISVYHRDVATKDLGMLSTSGDMRTVKCIPHYRVYTLEETKALVNLFLEKYQGLIVKSLWGLKGEKHYTTLHGCFDNTAIYREIRDEESLDKFTWVCLYLENSYKKDSEIHVESFAICMDDKKESLVELFTLLREKGIYSPETSENGVNVVAREIFIKTCKEKVNVLNEYKRQKES